MFTSNTCIIDFIIGIYDEVYMLNWERVIKINKKIDWIENIIRDAHEPGCEEREFDKYVDCGE